MRKNKKLISLVTCIALLVCSSAVGIDMEKTQAASRGQGALKTVSSNAVQTEEMSDATSGDSIQETAKPDQSDKPVKPDKPEESNQPDQSNEPAITPDVKPSNQPTGTTTPTAVQTTIPPVAPTSTATTSAVTNSVVYAAGDKFTAANYEYSVVTAPNATTKGTVKLKGLVEKAQTKTSLVVPATVSKDGYTFNVIGIGPKAFTKSKALKKVVIRKNVQYISIRAFQCVKTLESVTIGEDVTSIKERAFAGCTSLRNITIPAKVKLIGIRAFYKCTKLKSVVIESKKITTIKKYAFTKNKAGRYFVMPTGKKSLYKSLIEGSGAKLKIYTY